MSYDTILDAVVAAVSGVAGTANVYGEDPFSHEDGWTRVGRTKGATAQWWVIEVEPADAEGYVGGEEYRWRIEVRGFYGVARKSGRHPDTSDKRFARLVDDVRRALGVTFVIPGVIELTSPIAEPLAIETRDLEGHAVEFHAASVSLEAQEDT